ncbi:alpha/beta hydrolase [Mangrovibacterium sp.]|uniref:alpha/beta hydrolase n=1 Tax=Mangrovibacterium sp. TaxID=1961364 RepID=UPI0035697C81
MKKTAILAVLTFLMGALQAQVPQVSSGKIVRIHDFPSQYIHSRNIDVWLPDGYTDSLKYAVVYMHDGQMLYDSTVTWNKQEWQVDEVLSELICKKKVQPCIVVGVWNNDGYRHTEYFPQRPLSVLPDSLRATITDSWLKGKPLADNYLRFVVEELKPYIDKHFSTLVDQDHTFLAGSSMGGLISMYGICEYPEVFGGAACLSTHWIGTFEQNDEIPQAFNAYLSKHLPDPEDHRLYFDYGTATLDSLYEKHQLMIDKTMEIRGYDQTNWSTLKFEGDDHSERAWANRLHIPFTFLLQEPKTK